MPEVANVKGFTTGEQRWFVPCGWGYNSVIYRNDIVEPKEDSWNLLWDERYAGRISNAVEMDGAVIPAAMVLGIPDPYDMNDEQLAQVKAYLEKQRPLLRFYWTDPAELEQAIASGEVVAAYAWAASASTLKSKGVPITYMTPKEGARRLDRRLHHAEGRPGQGAERLRLHRRLAVAGDRRVHARRATATATPTASRSSG